MSAALPDHAIVATTVAEDDWRLFSPKLDDGGATYAQLRAALSCGADDIPLALRQIAVRAPAEGVFGLRARASALLLRDLIAMGWEFRVDRQWIFLRHPASANGVGKEAIRRQLEFSRSDQLRETATRRFLIGIERPSRFSACRPVTDLIADGRRLAAQLAPVARMPRAERAEALRGVCQPYLQLVDPNVRDEHTGLRLMDVWRYFRHTWVTRYRSTPGRNLFYLVRDAAQPSHPVMGITALGNAVMQLTPRDDALGWTPEGLVEVLARGVASEAEVLAALRQRLLDDLGQIYIADLPVGPDLTHSITDDVLDRLQRVEQQSTDLRAENLRDSDDGNDAASGRVHDVQSVDLEAKARTPLFRAKRARTLRELLRAYRCIRNAASIPQLTSSPDGRWALQQALRQLKKHLSATAVMEITVCGAAPPYNSLLAGKLACLLMMSPRVVSDYANRYDTGYSIIASQMAGRLITKHPTLVFLGTTSLYNQHSSQYNRVALPPGTVQGQRLPVKYEELGVSEGFGSPNLSSETEATLEQLAGLTRQYRNVNFVFGEGQSPKLRQLREGFAALGLNQTNLLHHGSPRIVYGVRLAENAVRFLLGVDSLPNYNVPSNPTADEEIAEFWRCRWLASRLDHQPALDSVARSTPLTERVSRLIPDDSRDGQLPLFQVHKDVDRPMNLPLQEDEKLAFIRHLYRDESAYSDNVKIARLRELNVKTKLDDVVRRVVRSGGSVVITGNAGDGKTHTIRLLEADLKAANAQVIPDASELPQEKVAADWAEARATGRPFCIAINEGPLVDLIRAHRAEHPWLEDIRQQLMRNVDLVPVDQDAGEDDGRYQPTPGETVVIDLSLRRTLAPDLAGRIIDKLTDDGWYAACAACTASTACPVTYNRKMLRAERVKLRLLELLDRVAERGVRATFREVLAYGSFLIFGGRSCAELQQEAPSEQTRYYWSAFEGQGAIFEHLEMGLDPVRQTDARVDEQLWRGNYVPAEFTGHASLPAIVQNFDEVQQHESQEAADGFIALKRRWYFEHTSGRLAHTSQVDGLFRYLQDSGLTTQIRVGRLIALVNEWWNRSDRDQQDHVRLWTRLSYSPRAKGRAMVSGRNVPNLSLCIFRPRLAPALRAAFGRQAVDYLVLAPPENIRFANLIVDRRLLATLLSAGITEQAEEVERRLSQFNDALAQHAESSQHVRTIEILDLDSELNVRVRVDLARRRYDSAQ